MNESHRTQGKRVWRRILLISVLLYVGGVFTLGYVTGSNVPLGSSAMLPARTGATPPGMPTGLRATPSPSPLATATPSDLASAPGTTTISMLSRGSGFAYAPAALSIPVGMTVRWVNNSNAPHTVTGFGVDSGLIPIGGQFTHTFSAPGTFAYKCTFHPSMTGVISVYTAAGGPTPTPPPPPPPAPTAPPGPVPTPAPGVVAVSIVQGADFAFSPAAITIPIGTTVRWTNSTGAPHTVTATGAAAGVFDSGVILAGGTYSHTFNQVGTFAYLCAIHPNMTGTVIVTSGATPTPPGSGLAQVTLVKRDGNYSFVPAALSIAVGTTVTWLNTTGDALTVDGPDFHSPLLPREGGTWSYTFTIPGTVSYTSRLRPEMSGTIAVSS